MTWSDLCFRELTLVAVRSRYERDRTGHGVAIEKTVVQVTEEADLTGIVTETMENIGHV